MITKIVPIISAHRPSKIVTEVEARHLGAKYRERARGWSDGVSALLEHRSMQRHKLPQEAIGEVPS